LMACISLLRNPISGLCSSPHGSTAAVLVLTSGCS
jgi:hypothetical protein